MKRLKMLAGGLAAALFAATSAGAQCGLCAKEVVINGELATCFLQEFPELSKGDSQAVAVDLSACGGSRGVVEALPSPKLGEQEPSMKFMLSRSQLACLKQKLEQPDLVLDPSAKIELGDC
jgi:hypothetical protein